MEIRAYDIDFGVKFRKIGGTLYCAVAISHPNIGRTGRAFAINHPRRIAAIVAIAFVLCVSGTVSAAGTHTVRAHTVSAHVVSAHTVQAHTATRCTALDGHCTTYSVKAHVVRAYTVAAHTVKAHTARNPRTAAHP